MRDVFSVPSIFTVLAVHKIKAEDLLKFFQMSYFRFSLRSTVRVTQRRAEAVLVGDTFSSWINRRVGGKPFGEVV